MPKEHKELKYKVSFATPAFLGNVDQQAQWRTPPFKALIRQWWRVVKAREMSYDVARLRTAENELFGTASDDGPEKSHRSLLRLRLSSWDDGKLKDWPAGAQQGRRPLPHPEAGRPVDAEFYLGYGVLERNRETHAIQLGISKSSGLTRTAIDEKSDVELRLMFPSDYEQELRAAMQLINWFGTVGSRARNGWGALQLTEVGHPPTVIQSKETVAAYVRPLADCLKLEWPHAIGADSQGPLIWKTAPTGTWRDVMHELAKLKIAYRTQATPFPNAPPGPIQARHLLAYPTGTKHPVDAWEKQARLANQMRFKVIKVGSQCAGIVVHVPCKLPDILRKELNAADVPSELAVWQSVHRVLDNPNNQLTRLG